MRERVDALREWLERLLLWRVWERMLEIEFIDRSVALAGKAFVSFFPLVIVVAAFVPEGARESILTTLSHRLGLDGRRVDDVPGSVRVVRRRPAGDRPARPLLHVLLRRVVHHGAAARVPPSVATTTRRRNRRALARCDLAGGGARDDGRARFRPRRPRRGRRRRALRGPVALGDDRAVVVHPVVAPLGRRAPASAPSRRGVITSVALGVFAVSATIWMPGVVRSNEGQFGFFGVALALVTWFSGAAMCILVGRLRRAGVRRGLRTGRLARPRRRRIDADRRSASVTAPSRARAEPPRRVPEHRRRMTVDHRPDPRGNRKDRAHDRHHRPDDGPRRSRRRTEQSGGSSAGSPGSGCGRGASSASSSPPSSSSSRSRSSARSCSR